MTRGKGQATGQKILSPSEIEALKGERQQLQETIDNLDGKGPDGAYGAGTRATSIDRASLEREDRYLRDAIEAGSPKKIAGVQKDRIADEAKELEARITEGMCSRDEMQDPRKHVGAIQKHVNWNNKQGQNVERWKQLQRQLNPGDPMASSVERLRK